MTIALSNLFRLAAAPLPVFPGPIHTAAAKTVPLSTVTAPPLTAPVTSALPSSYLSPLAMNYPWLSHTLAALFVVCAVALVILLAFQTTKQEGLSGTIGGRVESSYRPRLGADQQMARTTSYVAIAFAFFALLLSLTGI